jgi:hypothetical protein
MFSAGMTHGSETAQKNHIPRDLSIEVERMQLTASISPDVRARLATP